jgi:ankyrin repeat protein
MQTPVISLSLSAPPPMSGDNPPSSIMSGSGTLTTPVAPRQHKITNIQLSAFPNEVLRLIMRQVGDVASLFNLRKTCRQFNAIYQDDGLYKTDEWQYYKITYYIDTPVFYDILRSKLKTAMPNPGTAEWQMLQTHSLERGLTRKAHQIASLKKAYLKTWALLLTLKVLSNHTQAAALMKILLDLCPHIRNAEDYAATLFNDELAWQIFGQLADVHLDRCLQLVAKHFSREKTAFGYQFITTQLPAALKNPLNLIKNLKRRGSKSVLLYTLQNKKGKLSNKARLELLEVLIKRGCDVNQRNQIGETALHCLVEKLGCQNRVKTRDLSILHALLEHPQIKVNARDWDDDSALDKAISYKNTAIFHALLQNPKMKVYYSTLVEAIDKGRIDIVQALLRHPHIDVNAKDQNGDSALVEAIDKGRIDIVQAILEHSHIDINAKNQRGNSALVKAINKGEADIVQAMLQRPHIDVNTTNQNGDSALDQAINKRKIAVIILMLRHPHIDVNAKNQHGNSVLFEAIGTKDLAIIQIVLRRPHIDVNAKNQHGNSALDQAIICGEVAIIHALLRHPKIDITICRQQDASALYSAIQRHALDTVKTLLASSIDLRTRLTAFHYAIWLKKAAMIEVFLQTIGPQEKMAFINQALALAIKNQQTDIAAVLREQYAAKP